MAESIQLDDTAIAVGRTELDITSFIAAAGPDWGDAAIQAYMANAQVGETRLGYRLPNRQIKIPLSLRAVGGTAFATIRQQIQQKAALFQREGGWITRSVDGTALYADVQTATLHLGGSWLQAYRSIDVDAVLTLEALPDWYGDEVTLSDHVETTLPHLFFTEATVNGNYPGRVRIAVDNDGTVDWHGLLWSVRGRYYDAGTTAALFYEAEKLLPLNGAAGTALTGASGGSAVAHNALPAGVWASILSFSMMPGTVALTHTGSYRAWARCYSGSATPQFQLQWGVGSLASPEVNDPVQLPAAGNFYLLDLGECRLDAPPVGPNQWFGVIQAQVATVNDPVAIDAIWLQPLDDGAGRLAYVNAPPASSIQVNVAGTTGADDSTASPPGTVAWTAPTAAAAHDSATASCTINPPGGSHWLKVTGYNLAVPAGATIQGIQLRRYGGSTAPTHARLVKAGTVQSGTPTVGLASLGGVPPLEQLYTWGGPTDLWGASWSVSDVNNSGFGAAIGYYTSGVTISPQVNAIEITVWYALASGFTVAPDAVVAAGKTAELRTEGMFRQVGGTIYGPVSQTVGNLPRLPPSGLESRSIQVFLKPSRGNLDAEADSGIDDISAKVYYRPSYLYTP
jgi:hypothetical protein